MDDHIVSQVALAMNNAGLKKASELGAESAVLAVVEASAMLYDAAKQFTVLHALLGGDGMSALADGLAKREADRVVREAEDVLKEGSDGQG